MKWFGIGTAVMALTIASSAPMFGQERLQGPPGQSPEGAGGRDTTTQTGRSSSRDVHSGQAGRADAQGFINDMTIANLAEVQLGKMASEKASNSDVKSFGQMMVKDHTQANSELQQIASQLNVQPPAQLDQKHKDLSEKLSKLSGAEFDREYINAMVMGHEEVLGKLRAHADAGVSGAHSGAAGAAGDHGAAAGGDHSSPSGNRSSVGHGDEALTRWAAKVMPTVQKHLDRAKAIQSKVAK